MNYICGRFEWHQIEGYLSWIIANIFNFISSQRQINKRSETKQNNVNDLMDRHADLWLNNLIEAYIPQSSIDVLITSIAIVDGMVSHRKIMLVFNLSFRAVLNWKLLNEQKWVKLETLITLTISRFQWPGGILLASKSMSRVQLNQLPP